MPWQWWIHEAPHDYFRYTPYGLRYLLTQAGFRDITIEPQSGFFSMWVNKLNYFSLRACVKGSPRRRWVVRRCLTPLWYLGQRVCARTRSGLRPRLVARNNGVCGACTKTLAATTPVS